MDGTHFFVMEYVEGTDLARLVKKRGPLPVGQACEYIRQAALGLQHAHERGMVHRDIKPANLLLTIAQDRHDRSRSSTWAWPALASGRTTRRTLTQDGVRSWARPTTSPPSRRCESHDADIRADLYSLGCTLYFLLTGQPPFPGGTLDGETAQAPAGRADAAGAAAPDVPAAVAAMVRKLMAKKPEDRYQTPAELAAALAIFLSSGATAPEVSATPSMTAPMPAPVSPARDDRTAEAAGQWRRPSRPRQQRRSLRRPSSAPTDRRRPYQVAGAVGTGVLLLALLLTWQAYSSLSAQPA